MPIRFSDNSRMFSDIPPLFRDHTVPVFRDNRYLFRDHTVPVRAAGPPSSGRRPPSGDRRPHPSPGVPRLSAMIRPSGAPASWVPPPSARTGPPGGTALSGANGSGVPAGLGVFDNIRAVSKFACSVIGWDRAASQSIRTCTCQGDTPWTPGAIPPAGGPGRRRPFRPPAARLQAASLPSRSPSPSTCRRASAVSVAQSLPLPPC